MVRSEEGTIFDTMFLEIAQHQGTIENFLDLIFSFLQRKTDFFHVMTSSDDLIGFQKGRAKEMVDSIFQKHQELYTLRRNAYQTPDLAPSPSRPLPVPQQKERAKNRKEPLNCSDEKGEDEVTQTQCVTDSLTESASVVQPSATSLANIASNVSIATASVASPYTSVKNARRISTWNGGKTDAYWWSQTLSEVTVDIPLPGPHPVTKSQVKVHIDSRSLGLSILSSNRGDPATWSPVLPVSPLFEPIKFRDATWCIEDGERVVVTLEKTQESWWPNVLHGDPAIDLKKVESVRKLNEFDPETQASIERVMWDHQQELSGKKTLKQQAAEEALRKAWNVESSPFKGTPFNPDVFKFSGI